MSAPLAGGRAERSPEGSQTRRSPQLHQSCGLRLLNAPSDRPDLSQRSSYPLAACQQSWNEPGATPPLGAERNTSSGTHTETRNIVSRRVPKTAAGESNRPLWETNLVPE